MVPYSELKPVSLSEQAATLIRERIIRGDLKPGDRLVEQQLAKQMGVGQNVIREALIDLSHRGFVRRYANRGTYVVKLTIEEAHKASEVREALESLAVETVTRRYAAGQASLSEIEVALGEMRAAGEQEDRIAFYDADLRFHMALWQQTGNEYLEQALTQVVVPLFTFFIVINLRKGSHKAEFLESAGAHQRLVDQIKSGRPDEAKPAMGDIVNLALKHQQGLISE